MKLVKSLFFPVCSALILAVMFTGCNKNADNVVTDKPTMSQLSGTWSLTFNLHTWMQINGPKDTTFGQIDTLRYDIPDTAEFTSDGHVYSIMYDSWSSGLPDGTRFTDTSTYHFINDSSIQILGRIPGMIDTTTIGQAAIRKLNSDTLTIGVIRQEGNVFYNDAYLYFK
ncbi:MAG TPA: hypothetical protein VMH01_09905 [Puia sp.]|nr:hypothetical protein [Puia sp.]